MAYPEQAASESDAESAQAASRSGEGEVSDIGSSVAPGGPGQITQEPGRGRRIGHDPSPRPDAQIRAEIAQRLAASDEIDDDDIKLIVSQGTITLLGTVPDYASKRRVEAVCNQTVGVREIHDQLRVETFGISPAGLRTTAPRAGFRGSEK